MENKDKPKIIYHYTTQEGLAGILKDQSLWANKIHYMNDASELTRPLDIAGATLRILEMEADSGETKDKGKKESIKNMLKSIKRWSYVNLCVASFCTNGDLLSQWRGYGVYGSAYSIGFDTQKLEETINPHKFELQRCKYYDDEAYRKTIYNFILEVIEEAKKSGSVPADFIGRFVKMAATMKLECFREENEWRIISWVTCPQ